mmetsp:Transcript_134871/g.431022  ORF Transcript_134871/g.431022 Transcript_134871/m.431022 type:complete len:380 (-) Transcript_134871:39-1178(-)
MCRDFGCLRQVPLKRATVFFQAQRAHLCNEAWYLMMLALFHAKQKGCRLMFKGQPIVYASRIKGQVAVVPPLLALSSDLQSTGVGDMRVSSSLIRMEDVKYGRMAHVMLGVRLADGSSWAIDITGHQFEGFDLSPDGYPYAEWAMEGDTFRAWLHQADFLPGLADGDIIGHGRNNAVRSGHTDRDSVDEWMFRRALAHAMPDGSSFDESALSVIKSSRLPRFGVALADVVVDQVPWASRLEHALVSVILPGVSEDLPRCIRTSAANHLWRLWVMDVPMYMECTDADLIDEMELAVRHAHLVQSTTLSSPRFRRLEARTVLEGLPRYSAIFHVALMPCDTFRHIPNLPANGFVVTVPTQHPMLDFPVTPQFEFVVSLPRP